MAEFKYLNPLMKRGAEFLNVQYPVICCAMTWVSEPKLVAAVCNAGCFACIAGGNAPTDILKKQIEETRSLTDKPFAVNLITIAPAYKEHLAMLKDIKVPYIVFAGSFPKEIRRRCDHSGRKRSRRSHRSRFHNYPHAAGFVQICRSGADLYRRRHVYW